MIPMHTSQFNSMSAFLGTHTTNSLLHDFSRRMPLELIIFLFGMFFIGYLLLEQPAEGLGSLLHN